MPDKIRQTAPPLLCFLQYFGLPGEGGPRKWMWTALVSLMILFFCRYHQSYHQSFHMLSSLSSGVGRPLCMFWNRNFTTWAMWRDAHDLGWQTSVFGARLHLASWMIMDAGWRWLKVAEGGWSRICKNLYLDSRDLCSFNVATVTFPGQTVLPQVVREIKDQACRLRGCLDWPD